ncbi:type IV toxin-antitoxin system AbiEi family antitoxin domain-containing protein [Cryobacterium sp. PH29-G1]|uniref:type IV toxin-antitoxin system AbiEi family antitoxin domain-containing protein n=1 Tax=Cryobacterium sp. PH29-G1 TaxID=3046211 RepID=UPI0024B8D86B|nr:type IV toxin-antitoxin system AbiEi family antitoxin domain-containing protein [Cryobacterium sp. PH29-G1]MDJ0350668.1 type IV toxin-antitoxin system AbiEi family antitoxin domain-containing protein [Cryobacterium sp. PH29-G1]
MLDILNVPSARNDGLILAESLRSSGLTTYAVRALLASGELVRIRRGIYAIGSAWRAAPHDDRYRLFIHATVLAAEQPLLLSHLSAAALYHLPIIGPWPKVVHAINNDAAGGSSARFTTSHRSVVEPEPVAVSGCAATSLARTLIDVAATSSFLVGVTMMDHALRVEQERAQEERRRGRLSAPALGKNDLYTELAAVHPRTGSVRVRRVIDFADALSANPGESLSRVRIAELGFQVPELQVRFVVHGRDYWVDFYWRSVGKMGEFDGALKYTRGAVLGDRDPSDVVIAEKNRENLLRPLAQSFDRWDWDTAYSPRRFCDFLVEHDVPRA